MIQGVNVFKITRACKTLSDEGSDLDISSDTCMCESGSKRSEFSHDWVLVCSMCCKINCVNIEKHMYTLLMCLLSPLSPIGGWWESCSLLILHYQRISPLLTIGGWGESCLHVLIFSAFTEETTVIDVFDVRRWLIDACRSFQNHVCLYRVVCWFEKSTKYHVKRCIPYDCNAKRVSFAVPQTMNWPRPIDLATAVLWCTLASRCNFSVRINCADKLLSERIAKPLWHVRLTPFIGYITHLNSNIAIIIFNCERWVW